jgi:hypothetical protein
LRQGHRPYAGFFEASLFLIVITKVNYIIYIYNKYAVVSVPYLFRYSSGPAPTMESGRDGDRLGC